MTDDSLPKSAAPKKPAASRRPAAAAGAAAAGAAAMASDSAAAAEERVASAASGFGARAESLRSDAQRKAGEIGEEVTKLFSQAGDRAYDAAKTGKGKAAVGLESLAKLIDDTAGSVDGRLGKQYGDLTRSAATTVSGLAQSLDEKEIDELMASTRDFVKKSPAVAIGGAAIVGFILARMLRGGKD